MFIEIFEWRGDHYKIVPIGRELNFHLKDVSNNYHFSLMFSPFIAIKTDQQRLILKFKKPVDGPS
jgi:hypothetical protein